MASIKTVEYLCPHCGKKVSTLPREKAVSMGLKRGTFGKSLVNCKKCKKPYIQPFVKEAALFLTEAEQVPLLLCSTRLLVALCVCGSFIIAAAIMSEEILPVILAIIASVLGIFTIILVFGFFTRRYRQKKKNAVLHESRRRVLNNDDYLLDLINTPNLASTKEYLKVCFEADKVPKLN